MRDLIRLHVPNELEEWNFLRANSPQQSDVSACGVFTCINALAACLGQDPVLRYDSSHVPLLRIYIAAVLLEGGFDSELSLDILLPAPRTDPDAGDFRLIGATDLAAINYAAVADSSYRERAEEIHRLCGDDIGAVIKSLCEKRTRPGNLRTLAVRNAEAARQYTFEDLLSYDAVISTKETVWHQITHFIVQLERRKMGRSFDAAPTCGWCFLGPKTYADKIGTWGTCVLDEAHEIRNRNGVTTRSISKLQADN